MEDNAILISIHPCYVDKILTGEKRLEFRRSWAATPVRFLVIYATAPVQRIVAVAEIKEVYKGTRAKLWSLAKSLGGGICRKELFSYLAGKDKSFAIELMNVASIPGGLNPKSIFAENFRPPQSFRYLKKDEFLMITQYIGTEKMSKTKTAKSLLCKANKSRGPE